MNYRILKTKEEWRLVLKNKRDSLSVERKAAAKEQIFSALLPVLRSAKRVLSFYSLPNELDLIRVNTYLIEHKKLYLPRIHKDTLKIYAVTSLEKQLAQTSSGLYQPDPERCPEGTLTDMDCVLVPGLGFDRLFHRIGYGKGYYDRLLSKVLTGKVIGVGFKEQFYEGIFPIEEQDRPLNQLLLV